jgi:hypothetical protein
MVRKAGGVGGSGTRHASCHQHHSAGYWCGSASQRSFTANGMRRYEQDQRWLPLSHCDPSWCRGSRCRWGGCMHYWGLGCPGLRRAGCGWQSNISSMCHTSYHCLQLPYKVCQCVPPPFMVCSAPNKRIVLHPMLTPSAPCPTPCVVCGCSQDTLRHLPSECGLAAWQRRVAADYHKPVCG